MRYDDYNKERLAVSINIFNTTIIIIVFLVCTLLTTKQDYK